MVTYKLSELGIKHSMDRSKTPVVLNMSAFRNFDNSVTPVLKEVLKSPMLENYAFFVPLYVLLRIDLTHEQVDKLFSGNLLTRVRTVYDKHSWSSVSKREAEETNKNPAVANIIKQLVNVFLGSKSNRATLATAIQCSDLYGKVYLVGIEFPDCEPLQKSLIDNGYGRIKLVHPGEFINIVYAEDARLRRQPTYAKILTLEDIAEVLKSNG